jgi:hypothetical protein
MVIETRFPSREAVDQMLEMGMEKGMAAANGQIANILANGYGLGGSVAGSLVEQSNMGLTGFDISFCGRACDPSCSDSLNGAKNRIANEQFALAA